MLHHLRVSNFKCFEDQVVDFRPLTLLTGVNSAGKSSVIQALLLLQQSFARPGESSKLQLTGELVNLGLSEDVLNSNADDDSFTLEEKRDDTSFSVKGILDGNELTTVCAGDDLKFFPRFQYLNAERCCPRTTFPVPASSQLYYNNIGNQGEFAAYHLHVAGQSRIRHAALLASDAAGESETLQIQTEAWLSLLGSPVRLQTERPAGTDSVILRFSFPDISKIYYRPTNVGFGLTYTLPIFVAVLSAPKNSLLIVENPEAHLHPKGQVLMGRFLARAASCGIQVIMETHSDHVLNGIRVAVRRKELAHDAVQINFFHQQNGTSCIETPHIDEDGHIDLWPEDFFDEWDKQLSELL